MDFTFCLLRVCLTVCLFMNNGCLLLHKSLYFPGLSLNLLHLGNFPLTASGDATALMSFLRLALLCKHFSNKSQSWTKVDELEIFNILLIPGISLQLCDIRIFTSTFLLYIQYLSCAFLAQYPEALHPLWTILVLSTNTGSSVPFVQRYRKLRFGGQCS